MRNIIKLALLASVTIGGVGPLQAANLLEPPVFSSSGGVLDLLLIAKPTQVLGLTDGATPDAWAYQVCRRPASGNACPAGTAVPYGGVRLALQPGDTLKMRLVNQLPKLDGGVDRAAYDPLLLLNPTNIHTHGLIVDARPNTSIPPAVPNYGDFIFTSVFNPANGDPAKANLSAYNTLHAHGDVVKGGIVDYTIAIPAQHPPGSYWFHPHMHGISVNQISAGLAGIITIGRADQYACGDYACTLTVPDTMVRHLILKEMQIAAGAPQYQTDAALCTGDPAAGEVRNGSCDGDLTLYPPNSKWYFTVNGQQFPNIPVSSADGEIWRLQNASASMTYDLALVDNASGSEIPVQILSVDGVTVNVPAGTSQGDTVKLGGGRFKFAPCSTAVASNAASSVTAAIKQSASPSSTSPVCATELFMMPSSRVEIFVSYRDGAGRLASAPTGASAQLVNRSWTTGPIGDTWPQVNLATVQFPARGLRSIVGDFVKLRGFAWLNKQPAGIFTTANQAAKSGTLPAGCAPLAPGHRRRIYFGNPGTGSDPQHGDLPIFGLGYEEIDANGNVVSGTSQGLTQFDPGQEICLPLAKGNMPASETWEIINLTGEMHNFHIHQTKFRIINEAAPVGSVLASNAPNGDGMELDNVPLPYADNGDQTPNGLVSGSCSIDEYKAKLCKVHPVVVSIPFAKIGRFVYHCHVLEHEDGGMMHAIRVVPSVN